MSFGNIIKKLRSDRNMTQEQLAEVLSISAQAVSRWETNIALPDISLLPILANFFDVTTDFLLEVDASSREKEIESMSEAAREYTTNGQWSKGVEILRKAIRKYPSAYKLSHELASALYCSLQETDTISDEHYEKLLQEVVSLEENVLENSKDTELRHSAIQLLCYAYPKLNMPEKAESLANTMPYAHQCREDLLVSVSDKTKRYRYQQEAILTHLQLMLSGITFNCAPLDDNTKPYTLEELILLNKKYRNSAKNRYFCNIALKSQDIMTSLKEGDKAPFFKGINQDGKEITSEDFKGKKLVLYFYPKDNTSGCTAEEELFLMRKLYLWKMNEKPF